MVLENKRLQATVADLKMRLLLERHRREDLEVRAKASSSHQGTVAGHP
jgi:hypothetical protein